MTTPTHAISTETLLQLVAHPRRRAILHHLIENDDGEAELDKLTETIATDGGHKSIAPGSTDTRTGVELHHTHLPKLAAADIIKYDACSGIIRYHSMERVEKLLQFVSTQLE